jgi:hypothetical protein
MLHEKPTTVTKTFEVTSNVFHNTQEAMRGTNPDGPGQAAVNGLAHAVRNLELAKGFLDACGENL